jgi:NitT/TauT family transport system substrate-binding protein
MGTFLRGPGGRWRRCRKAQVQPGTRTFRRLASDHLDPRINDPLHLDGALGRRLTVLALAATLATGCSAGADGPLRPGENGRIPLTLTVNFTAEGDHSPYYVAAAKGWYADAGLDVSIEFSKGSIDAAQRAVTGKTDIAIADTGPVVAVNGNGGNLTIVGMLFDQAPQAIFTTRDTGIREPADLVGKKVAVPNGDTQRILFPALASVNHFDPADVQLINVAPSAKYGALASGAVDAIFNFSTGDPYVKKAVGADDSVLIPWRDHGLRLYGNGIVVTADWLAANREVLRTFLAVSYRAWAYTMAHPDEAIAILKRAVPQIDEPTYRQNLRLVLDLFRSKDYAAHGIGWINRERMCDTVATIQEYVPMQTKMPCDQLYTNDYLPKVPLPKSLEPAT